MCALYTAVHVGGPVQSRWCWVIGSSQHLLSLPHSLCGAVLGGLLCAASELGVAVEFVGSVVVIREANSVQWWVCGDCRQAGVSCVTCTHMLGRTVY